MRYRNTCDIQALYFIKVTGEQPETHDRNLIHTHPPDDRKAETDYRVYTQHETWKEVEREEKENGSARY